MSQANFARMYWTSAADEARCRNAVMGASKRPMPRKQSIDFLAQDRMDAQCLLLILNGKLRQDAGHTARKHRLARSRGPDHKQT